MKLKVILKENNSIIKLNEELNKTEVKDIVEKEVARLIKKMVQEELALLLRKNETKNDIADITKELMKKFYKDLSITSTYIIDRVKV
jgi:hypothetical protein